MKMVVQTINASVFKDTEDTKVGLTVTETGGKLYVDNVVGLFAATDLQPGDEVVTINGTLVDGMTSSEAVNIIKRVQGDVNVVAKRGGTPIATAIAVGSSDPPGKAPAGGTWGTLKYVGPVTQRNACIGCLCCGIPGCCILLCPSDEMDAYAVNGKVYDAAGVYKCPKTDKFTPKREGMQR